MFTLINVYGPNDDNPSFFVEVLKLFERQVSKRIITGDFNVTLNDKVDRTDSSREKNVKSAEIINEYSENTLMTDIWRDRNPDSRIYTYTRNETRIANYTGSRLDYFLVDTAISSWINSIKIFPKIQM